MVWGAGEPTHGARVAKESCHGKVTSRLKLQGHMRTVLAGGWGRLNPTEPTGWSPHKAEEPLPLAVSLPHPLQGELDSQHARLLLREILTGILLLITELIFKVP